MVQHPLLAHVVTPLESHLSSVDSVTPNEDGVPPTSPSSTDIGGGQLVISREELKGFLASSPSSVVLGSEQNYTDDAFFTREVEAFLMSDDNDTTWSTIPMVDLLLMPDNTRSDSTTVAKVSSSSSSIDFVACEHMYYTANHFLTSLEHVRAFLMSNDTQPVEM
ncbi:unnamed protein product [Musa textilis]